MQKIKIFLLIIFLSGCATRSINMGPVTQDWESGEPRQIVVTSLVETNSFAPSVATTIVQECKGMPINKESQNWPEELDEVLTDEKIMAQSRCRITDDGYHDSGKGAMASVIPAVIGGASMVGAAALMADGLRESGDNETTTNNNTSEGSNSDSNSESEGGHGGHGTGGDGGMAFGGDGGMGGDGGSGGDGYNADDDINNYQCTGANCNNYNNF